MCEQHPLSIRIAQLSKSLLISPPKLRQRDALARRPRELAPWARRGQPLAKLGSFISTVRPRLVQTHASRGHRPTGLAPGASAKLPTRGLSDGGGGGGDGGEGGGHGSGGDAGCCDGGCGCRGNDILRAMRQRAPPPSVARPATAALCSRDRAAVQVEARASTQHFCRL